MANQLNLSPDEINQILSKVGQPGTVGQYSAAYQEVLNINQEHAQQGLPTLDAKGLFWFQGAVGINANDPTSNTNLFIRDVTAAGLELDGKSIAGIQDISNSIGKAVIDEIKSSGGVPDVGTLLQQDISNALSAGGQTIGGWGGAFYYWNTPYQTDANGNTVTVGQAILSDPVQYEKFVATNAKALSDTLGFDQASGGISAVIKDL
jgi:hypothetical protein